MGVALGETSSPSTNPVVAQIPAPASSQRGGAQERDLMEARQTQEKTPFQAWNT